MTNSTEEEFHQSGQDASTGIEQAVQEAVALLEAMKAEVDLVETFIDRLPRGDGRTEDARLISELRADTNDFERTLERYSFSPIPNRTSAGR